MTLGSSKEHEGTAEQRRKMKRGISHPVTERPDITFRPWQGPGARTIARKGIVCDVVHSGNCGFESHHPKRGESCELWHP